MTVMCNDSMLLKSNIAGVCNNNCPTKDKSMPLQTVILPSIMLGYDYA